MTRDRVSYDATWTGRRFVVQDTGGWEPDAKGLQQLVAEQASVAMRPPTRSSSWSTPWWARPRPTRRPRGLLRRSGKPVFLAANKVDNERGRIRRRGAVVAGAG